MSYPRLNTKELSSRDIITAEDIRDIIRIVSHFESQVKVEAAKLKWGGMSNRQKEELCTELGKLQEIKRKLKLMKG